MLMVVGIIKTNGFGYLVRQIPEALFLKRTFYVLEYDLDKAAPLDGVPNNWEIRKNDIDYLEYCRQSLGRLPLEFNYDKIDKCDHFYILSIKNEKNPKPAAICWIYNNRLINRVIKLKDNEVELKHGITLDEHRGLGMFTILVKAMLYDLKTMGYKKTVNIIEEHNDASLTIFRNKYKFEITGKKTLRKIAGITVSKRYES